jgi:hypothetical protein
MSILLRVVAFAGFMTAIGFSPALGQVARAADANVTKLNTRIEALPLRDADGKPVKLPVATATVVVFLSFDCPVSNSYAAPLADLAKEYGPKGVTFVGLDSTDAPAEEAEKQAKEWKLGFPIYRDANCAAADSLKAETTPEVFVLDRHSILRYRGRIDNGYYARLKKNPQVTAHELKEAIDDLLAGKSVRRPATPSIGCPIVRPAVAVRTSNPPPRITYYRDVAPILQGHCQGCHRPGEVGPFRLDDYKQAVKWAADIKTYTQDRAMPPWKPAVAAHRFADDRRMSDKDIATLAEWVDAGTPEGDPKDAPPPAKFVSGWQLGQPDLVLTPPEDFTIGASGTDLFRCYVLPTGLTEDRYVIAYEVRPGNRRVVHHTLNFIDTAGRGRALEHEQQEKDAEAGADLEDHGPGYSRRMGVGFAPRGGIGGWAPGQQPHFVPEGVGFALPKNSDVVLQVHYHRTGRVETDRPQIGLYLAKKPVQRTIEAVVISPSIRNPLNFIIPPGLSDYRIKGSIWLADDCTLFSVMPHMHLIGRRITVTITPPDAEPATLIAIKDWDYNWQETYYFKEPLRLKAGTRFDIEGVYDNSRGNPFNPSDPPKLVRFGEQTTNEMCFGFLQCSGDKPGPVRWYIDEDKKILMPGRARPRAGAAR